MSFRVKPVVLNSASAEIHAITGTISAASAHADEHLSVPSGGRMINGAREELEKVRAILHREYGSEGRSCDPLRSSAFQLYFAAVDYETIDHATRQALDAEMNDPGSREGGYGTWDDLDPAGEQRGVEISDYSVILNDPTSSFDDYEQWRLISSKVDEVLDFDWISAPLDKMGLSDPIAKFREDMDGDWTRIGLAIGALGGLVQYWNQVCNDLGATVKAVDAAWDGHASNSAIGFFHDYAHAAQTHARALDGVRKRLQGTALGIRMALDTVLDAVEGLVDLMPQGDSITEFAMDLVKSALEVPSQLIGKIRLVFDALFVVCGLVVSAFSQLAGHDSVEFPEVDMPSVLPVAGV